MRNPLNEMPGKKINSLNELIEFINCCIRGEDEFKQDRFLMKNKVFKYQDNNNSKRLMEWLIEKRNS